MTPPPSLFSTLLMVGAGSAVGGMARFLVAELVARQQSGVFPLGTLLVNVLGSLAIGFLAEVMSQGGRWPMPPAMQSLLLIGLLGGFTTFSAFSLQTLVLLRSGHLALAGLNIVGSVALCLLGAWAGFRLGLWISR